MLRRSLPRRFIIVRTVFIRHFPPINFPNFFLCSLFLVELIIVDVDLKQRPTPSQGVAIKKNSVSSRTCHFYRLTSQPDRSKIFVSTLDDHKNYLDESTGFSDRLLY